MKENVSGCFFSEHSVVCILPLTEVAIQWTQQGIVTAFVSQHRIGSVFIGIIQ